jgi:hypothetical protein
MNELDNVLLIIAESTQKTSTDFDIVLSLDGGGSLA